ncbi:MAG: hypothetical protein P9M05_08080, partial [Candidatus Stygibacter australis]|nr:hypothetical protein [Candidatus Stygibacter australis]
MNSVVGNVLSEYITKDSRLIDEIISNVGVGKSIVEITGASGTGKSFIFEKLNHVLLQKQYNFKVIIPRVRGGNHFHDFIHLLTGMEKEEYQEIILKSKEYQIKNRYDFYYYFTRQIEKRTLIADFIIIYESSYLDQYTRDFIQFLNNYLTKANIKFVVFSSKSHYPDGYNIDMKPPTQEDIANILANLSADEDNDFVSEAEVIEHVSEQNYYSIQYLLENYFNSTDKLQMDKLIDRKITLDTIYQESFAKLNETEMELLLYIFLLDTRAERKYLNELLGRKTIKALKVLESEHLIMQIGDNYYVRKVEPVKVHFNALKQTEQKRLISMIKEYGQNEICNEFLEKDPSTQEICLDFLDLICDQENLLKYNNLLLGHLEENEEKVKVMNRISQVKKETRDINEAIEILRNSLKLAQSLNLPIYWIIHELADCLSINTNYAFALEVIKKYSPAKIDDYWQWKIMLLKSRLFMQMEDFEQALEIEELAYNITSKIENHRQSMQMRAET